MKLFRYNYNDIDKASKDYSMFSKLTKHLYSKNWLALNKYNNIVNPDRWVNYIYNLDILYKYNVTPIQLKDLLKLASYRELGDYKVYGDLGIPISRLPKMNMQRIPLIKINNDKIYLSFEEK